MFRINPFIPWCHLLGFFTIPVFPHMMWGFFLSITYMQSKVKTVTYRKL
ncbi:hypothetical protein CGG59_003442 [Salmonella enterica subsp. enterica serovar London]|nr:hypothetical protein [Salmonella enterica subsp. enterica serovar London]EDR9846253.1 hypothetical protein [Salmonella enterica subsp. enterica serovar London]